MKDNRLFRILYYILEKEKVTANELAEKFEVSVRTIYRDIDSISSVGVPIFTTQGKGGGIKIDNEFILNKSLFDANEKEQIIAALQGLEKTNEAYKSELITKLSALFKIKNSNWIEIDFTSWGSNNTYQDLFNALKTTIINKNIISFSYNSSKAEKINRKVKPIRLLFKEQDWYLYAFCLLRNDFRYFKLSRMKDLEVLAINYEDNFENAVLKKELKYENIVNIKLKFDKSVAFRVYDEFNEAIEEDEKGNLYVEIKIPNNYKLYNYIFSFGSNVEILEPKEIRNQFKNMINEIAKKYI
ncbi:helix-turn-helix transcriptional regulator [Fusobacterium animalis]|uniref:DNA-binding transcriptional regulator n=1 Tax=Fusobacterium animalis TaxID=76859 RepID=A0A2B7YRQ2_9FUSO|nr:YafY family protein [Fusobacterium animalis]PGH23995.1 DNA-binding transcriptional regulator [Fusobacterium animalis]